MRPTSTQDDLTELRLLVEEIVCNVFRFAHEADDKVSPENVFIRQEVPLQPDNAFADIHVSVPGVRDYFVEVDLGYTPERLLESLGLKFTNAGPRAAEASRLVLVYDPDPQSWPELQKAICGLPPANWALEVWNTAELLARVHRHFGVNLDALTPERFPELLAAIDGAKGKYVFGDAATNELIESTLLWEFSHWRLRQMFARTGDERAILSSVNCVSVCHNLAGSRSVQCARRRYAPSACALFLNCSRSQSQSKARPASVSFNSHCNQRQDQLFAIGPMIARVTAFGLGHGLHVALEVSACLVR